MLHRWVGYWLMFCFGILIVLALIYVFVYQRLLDSPDYYPFWLAEPYFYLGLPAAALITWKVHWGKNHPLQYFVVTLVILIGVVYLGSGHVKEHRGERVTDAIQPVGVVDRQLITREGMFEVPYYPMNRERLTQAVRNGEEVEVTLVREKGLILSFEDEGFAAYPLLKRLMDFALGVFAAGVFAVFFYVVMSVWWREFRVKGTSLRISHWGRRKEIPFSEVIHVRLDSFHEEIRVETEEMVSNFPYNPTRAAELAEAAKRAGLTPIRNGRRWVRHVQYREVRLEEDRLILEGDGQEKIPYDCVAALGWDPVIQITMMDETNYTITDVRYTDRAWFEELAAKVRHAWEKNGQLYSMDVDPRERRVALSLYD
ncbi:hypothetical protein C8P63_108119 [Melghirimyces profundicolus]|uniref:Uncharacterized protein n=1 Tax=Melghirimyces profundicolus TaxID=1242148 RepID=A0A2T6BXK3_9BACL|nr:hypothetical protein [Melghirimyces profundicolus]PTX60809.1 hypothetical protein C8P63_108119 [Melghirimyces profundicolus]